MTAQSYSDGNVRLTIYSTPEYRVFGEQMTENNNETASMRKFAREYMEKYPSVKKVYTAIAGNRRRGSEVTAEHYINAISLFVKYIRCEDPETALRDMLSGKVDAQKNIDGFIDYALDEMPNKQNPKAKGRSHNTVRNYAFGVKKWFDQNDVKVNWDKIEMPTGTETVEHDRAPTKEELRTLIAKCNSSRDRAIIYCDTACGLRINTLLSLTIGDVDFSYPDVARLTVLRKPGRKFGSKRGGNSGNIFVSWLTPEAKAELKNYLEERERSGEKLAPESPLFTDAYNTGKFIDGDDFGKVYKRLLKRAGLDMKSNRWYLLHLHTLRKYMRSNCVGVDASYREMWMGHKGQYLDISYFRAEEQRHLDEYRKVIPHLTVQEQKKDNSDMKKEIALTFLRMQGYSNDKLKKFEEIFQRAKNSDEAFEEFRKLKDDPIEDFKKFKEEAPSRNPSPTEKRPSSPRQKYTVAKGEGELVQKLDSGWNLIQTLSDDKYLLKS
jgi:integrase